jgi:hypothetical protein
MLSNRRYHPVQEPQAEAAPRFCKSGFQAFLADNGTCYIIRHLRLEPQIPLKFSPHHAYKTVGMARSKQACRWKRARAIA